uniref:Uncharacterized protein n=1 Tax=Glossina austeni TaxID=7395 RepID=A0A1A9ULT3_GLOAU
MLPDPVEPTTLSRQPAVELLPPEEELASDKGRKLELLEAYKGSISLVMMGVLTVLLPKLLDVLKGLCEKSLRNDKDEIKENETKRYPHYVKAVSLLYEDYIQLQSPPFSLPPQFLKP